MLAIILLVFALVLFVIGFFTPPAEPYRSAAKLGFIGLACWVASELLTRLLPK